MSRQASTPDPQHVSMSFGQHLEELRRRLIYALIGVGVTSTITMFYGQDIIRWLCQPLFEAQRQAGLPMQTVNLSVGGGFMVWLKVSTIAALALAAPWVVYQIWKFISSGLYPHERRFALLIAPFSSIMGVIGVLFLYYIFLPAALSFLLMFSSSYPPPTDDDAPSSLQQTTGFFNRMNEVFFFDLLGIHGKSPDSNSATTQPSTTTQPTALPIRVPVVLVDPPSPEQGQVWFNQTQGQLRMMAGGQKRVLAMQPSSMMLPQIEINQYLDFVLLMGLVVVVMFQLPVVMTLAAAIGLLNPAWLSRYRKHIVFTFFVLGVIITPNQDLVSNLGLPLVMWVLFEMGLLAMRLAYPKPDPQDQETQP